MPLGPRFVAGFHEQPKVFDLQTGQVVWHLPELSTGKQASSIIHHLDPLPPLALDPRQRRFAVASSDEIHIVELSEEVS